MCVLLYVSDVLEYSNIGLSSIRAAWAEAIRWEPTAARVHVDLGAVLKHLQRHKEVRRRRDTVDFFCVCVCVYGLER